MADKKSQKVMNLQVYQIVANFESNICMTSKRRKKLESVVKRKQNCSLLISICVWYICIQRHDNVRLQIASVYCINNLVWNQEDGATERQSKLKEYGVQKQLQSLLSASDTVLFDK